MGHDTSGRIGKVIPLRQHARDPAAGSAISRLLARTSDAPGALAGSAEDDGELGALRTWLATLETLHARRAEALEAGVCELRVADGALSETLSHLRRMRELADTASGLSSAEAGRGFEALAREITRVAENTDFGGRPLLSGPAPFARVSADALGVRGIAGGDPSAAPRIDEALDTVTRARANLARLEGHVASLARELEVARENVAAAGTRPEDVDGALHHATALRARVVEDSDRATRSLDVVPGVVVKLVR